jgi:hypothetical protein
LPLREFLGVVVFGASVLDELVAGLLVAASEKYDAQ